jgi:hypothetical protein
MSESAHIALYELAMDTKEDNHVSNVRLQSEHYICRQNPVYSTTHPNLLTTTYANVRVCSYQPLERVELGVNTQRMHDQGCS